MGSYPDRFLGAIIGLRMSFGLQWPPQSTFALSRLEPTIVTEDCKNTAVSDPPASKDVVRCDV